ncbi:MAG: CoA transferase [Acidimicrobiales bacterium]|nr:CoA transferase [Acidimicrobiales bacterium]
MTSGRPLEGVTVVEVSSWMFIPAAGAVLADWGATVLKVEHPETGDPQRGLVTSGLLPGGADGVNFMMEQPNRGKQSVGVDIADPDGHEALMRLVEGADVFLTNYLPHVREKLRIDVDHLRARNPDIIVARGTGQGTRGPDAWRGGYDAASFWARGGVASVMPDRNGWPPGQPAPAFGDVMGGMSTAGAIAAALFQRSNTGETSTVDVSLLATAMWQVSPLVVASKLFGFSKIPTTGDRPMTDNPGVGTYRTADGRYIGLVLLQADRFWAELVTKLDVPELATDERFADTEARKHNLEACVTALDDAFGARPLSHWREVLADFSGVWAPYQNLDELYEDPQVIANGYLPTMTAANGQDVQLVANPAQFDEQPVEITRGPDHGEHTDEALLALGYTWDDLIALKQSGAIL